MLLDSIIPALPTSTAEILIYIVGGLGALLLGYGVFLEQERRQDLVRFVGAFGLMVYALFIDNKLFIVAMGGLAIASLVEFVEIYLGLHKHSPEDLKRYKEMR